MLLTTDLSPVQRRYAEELTDAGEALLALINDILDFSKLEAGMVELEHREFDPRTLVEGVAGILGTPAPPPDVELIAHCDAGVPQRRVGDESRLRQILLNLGSNAVKFTHRGEIVITARVAAREGRHVRVRFEVADTGIGIDVEAQRTLFDSFAQAEVSTTRKYGGTGLGLSICKSLAEAMGGTIGVESARGRGSTFWVEIPMPVAETQVAPGPDPHPLQGWRVLVVDDNDTHRLGTGLASTWSTRTSSELLEMLLDLVPAPPVVARDEERPITRAAEGRAAVACWWSRTTGSAAWSRRA